MELISKHIITVLVSNKSGVLARVSGLFARRGYNIDSLVVCGTENEQTSRMTLVVTGSEAIVAQIIKQLDKLQDVERITELEPDASVLRELLLIKIKLEPNQRPEIESVCNIYKAKIVDLAPESAILELTGEGGKLDAFIELLKHYSIIELTRTGIVALHRGKENINDEIDDIDADTAQ